MKDHNNSQGFVDYFGGKEQETKGVISEKSRNMCAAAERHPELDQDAPMHSHTITTIILRPAQPGESMNFRLLRAPNILQLKRGDKFNISSCYYRATREEEYIQTKGVSALSRVQERLSTRTACQDSNP